MMGMTVLEEEVRGKFRQGGGHESTEGMGSAEGLKRRARRFLDISRLNIRKGAAGLRGCSLFTII